MSCKRNGPPSEHLFDSDVSLIPIPQSWSEGGGTTSVPLLTMALLIIAIPIMAVAVLVAVVPLLLVSPGQ
jgi:hypothetical protein